MGLVNCPVCNETSVPCNQYKLYDDINRYECMTCGIFMAHGSAVEAAQHLSSSERFALSTFLIERHLKKLKPLVLFPYAEGVSNDKNGELCVGIKYNFNQHLPKTISERLNRSLQNLSRLNSKYGAYIEIGEYNKNLFFAEDNFVLRFTLKQLTEDKYIEWDGIIPCEIMLTVRGWNKVAELETFDSLKSKKQGFIAMWFDDSMNEASLKIQKAIEDAGYQPIQINLKEHNNDITDEIIAEIRKSRFLVADFTNHRGGVYFESGFAMGLDLPVIRCCRKDHMSNIHFDTRQYNHIVWETPEELYKKLKARIEATIVAK